MCFQVKNVFPFIATYRLIKQLKLTFQTEIRKNNRMQCAKFRLKSIQLFKKDNIRIHPRRTNSIFSGCRLEISMNM